MELLTIKNIELKNTVRKLLDPFEFDLEMHCKEDIQEGVIFSVIYTVNVSNESEDQILSETEICPIPKGNIKFSLEADAPDLSKIPYEQLFGLTSIIIIGKYKDQQFMRVGYIVDVYYPGISNEKLLYNEAEEDAEDIVDEDLEEEEDENENFDDLIVEDEEVDIENTEEDAEEILNNEGEVNDESKKFTEGLQENLKNNEIIGENDIEPRKFTEAVEDNLKNSENIDEEEKSEKVNESEMEEFNQKLEAPIAEEGEEEDYFEFRGFKINRKNIEMNVMIPPSVHSFLIGWKEESEEIEEDLEEKKEETSDQEENVKKMKIEE